MSDLSQAMEAFQTAALALHRAAAAAYPLHAQVEVCLRKAPLTTFDPTAPLPKGEWIPAKVVGHNRMDRPDMPRIMVRYKGGGCLASPFALRLPQTKP